MVRDDRRLALVPATDLDHERLRSLPRDWPFQVQTLLTRTSKLNRWYRGIVGHAAAGLDVHPDALHVDLKLKAGLIDQVIMSQAMRGIVAVKVRSTAFPEMRDDEFSNYCDFAIPCIFRDYLGHIQAKEQRRLVTEWAGRRPKLEEPPKFIVPR